MSQELTLEKIAEFEKRFDTFYFDFFFVSHPLYGTFMVIMDIFLRILINLYRIPS